MRDFLDLMKRARSYRRFDASYKIGEDTVKTLLSAARLTPSGANRQVIRYFPITDGDGTAFMRTHSRWAAYLSEWGGPTEGECPTAWILLLSPLAAEAPKLDLGIAAEAIVLAATAAGLGTCIFLSIERAAIAERFGIGEDMRIDLAIALGKPSETVIVSDVTDGDIRYYRDEADRHVVPKRTLDELIYRPDDESKSKAT